MQPHALLFQHCAFPFVHAQHNTPLLPPHCSPIPHHLSSSLSPFPFPSSFRAISKFFRPPSPSTSTSSVPSSRILVIRAHENAHHHDHHTTATTSSSQNANAEKNVVAKAKHILVDTEELAIQLKVQALAGAKFEDLVVISKCDTKAQGGSLGWVRRGLMAPEVEKACFEAPLNEPNLVKSGFGWHVVLVETRRECAPLEIDVEQFHMILSNPDQLTQVQIIDCRERDEIEKARIEGLMHLPMHEYHEWKDGVESGQTIDYHTETIVLCHKGSRANQFCTYLQQKGFSNVRTVVGGIDEYARKIDPSIGTY